MTSDSVNEVTPVQLALSSWAGALITSFVVTPLDVVKIRIQAQDKDFAKKKCFIYCNGLMDHLCYCNGNGTTSTVKRNAHGSAAVPPYKWFQRPGQFNGTLDAMFKIARNEGITSLWSGLRPTLIMSVPGTMIYFMMYDGFRSYTCRVNDYRADVPPLWVPVVAGALARTAACTVVSPLEMIRTKMQSRKLASSEVFHAVKESLRHEGVRSLYRGWIPTIMRDVPFSGIYWLNYEFLKKQFNQPQPVIWFSLCAGAASGSVAAVVTLPFDVVKTHRQIEFGEKELLSDKISNKATSTLHIMRQIHSQRGIRGLFSGIVPRLVKVAPACAIMISTYEYGKAFFRRYNSSGRGFFEYLMHP